MEDKQLELRKSKLEELRAMDIDPYANSFTPEHITRELVSLHASKSPEELGEMEQFFSLAGRVVSKRDFRKSAFFYLSDRTGRIQ